MRARTAIAGVRPGARLTAVGCAAVAILATTTACSTPSGAAAAGTTSATASGTPTGSVVTALAPSSRPTSTPAGGSPSSVPVQPTPFASVTQPASPVPVGAPSTGGGGTAGVEDLLLFGLGGAALLAGAGTLAYRRRTLRDR